jgi:hypothetical protein
MSRATMSGVGVGTGEGVRVAVGTADGVADGVDDGVGDGVGNVVAVEVTSKVSVGTGVGTGVPVGSPTVGTSLTVAAVGVISLLSIVVQPPRNKVIVSRKTIAFISILRIRDRFSS